jgi:hypothetical protein
MSGGGNDGLAQATASIARVVFSAVFPFMLVMACAVSAVLAGAGLPQFGLLAQFASGTVAYAGGHAWAALALGAFVLSALPLLWVAYREHAAPVSTTFGMWVGAAVYGGGLVAIAGVWPPAIFPVMQRYVFGLVLFVVCGAVIEAVTGTLKFIRQNRPQEGREVVEAQKAHGHAQVAGEEEAISLLRSKK